MNTRAKPKKVEPSSLPKGSSPSSMPNSRASIPVWIV